MLCLSRIKVSRRKLLRVYRVLIFLKQFSNLYYFVAYFARAENHSIMKRSSYLLIAIACIVACGKSDVPSSYVGLHISKQLKVTAAPKMYTRNGEVTDKMVVNQYLDKIQSGGIYFIRNIDTVLPAGNDTVRFLSTDTATIKRAALWEKRVVKPQGDYLYLHMLDTIRSFGNSNTTPFDEVVQKIGIYQPYYKILTYFPGGGYLSDYSGADIMRWRNGKVVFPFMNYSIIRNVPNGSLYGTNLSGYNNIFNSAVVSLLKDHDTLLLQTFELTFEKVQ